MPALAHVGRKMSERGPTGENRRCSPVLKKTGAPGGGARSSGDDFVRRAGNRPEPPYRLQVINARGRESVTRVLRMGRNVPQTTKEHHVPALLLVLLIILILFALGIAGVVKLLLWVAIILAIVWLIGFFVRGAEGARWYRW